MFTQIRFLRMEMGISQRELGRRMNIKGQTISAWENEEVMPSPESLMRLAAFFETSVDYILGLTDMREKITGTAHQLTLGESVFLGHYRRLAPEARPFWEELLFAFLQTKRRATYL